MKETAAHQFRLRDLKDLRSEIARLHLDVRTDEDLSPIGDPLDIGGKPVSNRLCVQPMEGQDARPDGSPGELTFRRYTRYAQGGFGLVWIEATAVLPEARSNPAQLYLHRDNVARYAGLVEAIRRAAPDSPGASIFVILQLTHAGRYSRPGGTAAPMIAHHNPAVDAASSIPAEYPVVTDAYLDELRDKYVESALLAREAGFDGVDVKSCHGNLVSELLASFTRPGLYGGDFEGRTRFLRETVEAIREKVPGLVLCTRMNGYDAATYPYGFGVDRNDVMKPDVAEPVRLINNLREKGLSLVSISTGMPSPRTNIGKAGERPEGAAQGGEHPLARIAREMDITRKIQKSVPGFPVVGGGYSWLRHLLPFAAAGTIGSGGATIVGLGRSALACPGAAKDIIERGSLEPSRCCIACSACSQLLRDGGRTGCVIQDSEVYGPEYRMHRRFAPDALREQARRCHECETAPCTTACPAAIDVPAFIGAFANDDIPKAYEVIRRSNVLPEMCSYLCPAWMMCEGACIEQTLTGTPIPVRDIQLAVCRAARDRGLTGIRVAAERSGRRVVVAGAGPAGLAAAARLVEKGHSVTVIERDKRPGGMPESIICADRYAGAEDEVDPLLRPAFESGALTLEPGRELGVDVSLDDLTEQYDAVLLATGLWQEISIGAAAGVVDALAFLRQFKSGEPGSIPGRVAILGGGDSAMDVALAVTKFRTTDVYVVYGGSFSDMHWHMSEGWFRANGVHCLMLTDPIGYEVDTSGKLTGLKVQRTEYGPPDISGTRLPGPVDGSEWVLEADMVIEAMGLKLPDVLKDAVSDLSFTDSGLVRTAGEDSCATGTAGVFAAGAVINGGASVCQCVAEGMKAADEIDNFLRHQ